MEKERLDVLLVNRGMVESREKTKAITSTTRIFLVILQQNISTSTTSYRYYST